MSNQVFPLGTNLAGIASYSPQFPFTDYFKSSRDWRISGDENQVEYDDNGWITSLGDGTIATTSFPNNNLGETFVVLYEGEGEIKYAGGAQQNQSASQPGRDVINIKPGQRPTLTITSTDPNDNGNYLQDIRIVPQDDEAVSDSQIFNPDFVESLDGNQVLRFMDWMATNNSDISEWSDRPQVDDMNYSGEGVPVEIMVELANQTGIDPWFTIPHLATDEYVENFAEYVEEHLDPNLEVYVEFSNEVWNNSFRQTRYAREQGAQEFPGASSNEAARSWFTQRTMDVIQTWEETFDNDSERVIGVLGAKAANDGLTDTDLDYIESTGLSYEEAGIDAVAIAPYFNLPLSEPENVQAIEAWVQQGQDFALDQLFQEITVGGALPDGYSEGSIQKSAERITDFVELAEETGLDLIAYEGGQHIAPRHNGMHKNEAIADLFNAANRDPRMGEAYGQYFDMWAELSDEGLFAHFTDVSRYSEYGSCGSRESLYQESSPKFDALQEVINEYSSSSPVEAEESNPDDSEPTPVEAEEPDLLGTTGNDKITGSFKDELIVGGAGNDTIRGKAGNDTLIGVDDQDNNPGMGERDLLRGGAGADKFILGNSSMVFYDDNGTLEAHGQPGRGVILDFNVGEDMIQLSALGNYEMEEINGSTKIFEVSDVARDTIGVVRNVVDLDLQDTDQFVFV
ncbi:MAG: cellulose-binding protein [Microcoleaceae cyanobacterium]